MSRLALRFISGKHKGEDHILAEDKETVIGRSASIELVLVEDMVSRKHAQITIHNGKIQIEDLGSTNGTFVNGERISKASVKKGDRILIGTSIMKVVEVDDKPSDKIKTAKYEPEARIGSSHSSINRSTIQPGSSISGAIAEVPLPDLLQLFATSKKTGTLVITQKDRVGKIHLDNGRVVYSEIDDMHLSSPLKAIFRLLAWQDGSFEMLGPEPADFPEPLELPTEHILMEGLRHLDETRHLQDRLPTADSELVVVAPLVSRLTDLSKDELEVFQLIYNHGTVRSILDRSKLSDLDAIKILLKLLEQNYVIVV